MIEQISVSDLKKILEAGPALLIDVREQQEYDGGHVPGATWIPMSLVPLRKEEFQSPEPVYVVCRTGNRSGQVVMWLANQGIETVNVAGGTVAWANQGFPVETGSAGRTVQQ